MNTVPCVTWVKRGAAKQVPDRVRLTEDDFKKLIRSQEDRLKGLELGENSDDSEDESADENTSGDRKRKKPISPSKADTETKPGTSKTTLGDDDDDFMKRYGLESYDDDDEDDDGVNALSIEGLAFYTSNAEDPHLEKGQDDSDDEDMQVTSDDNMIVIGKVSDQFCNLEVHIYNEADHNIYCHHDLLLPTFPLALEWLDFDPGEDAAGNFVALGTMEPDIEIWDLDVIDAVEPAFTLAGAQKKTSKKKKKKTSVTGHTDAVLDLSWNHLQRNVLASASADFTVGLWDLENGTMVSSIQQHQEKVQSLQWHPFEAESLISGSFDQTVKLYDCRSPDSTHKSWDLDGEVERVLWNHHDPYFFFASTDGGMVYCMDVRTSSPVFTMKAHFGGITGLCMSSTIPGVLVTCSEDKTLKAWDILENKPAVVVKRNMKMGALQCTQACPDAPLLFAVGGEREVRVVNLKKNDTFCQHFGLSSVKTEENVTDAAAAAEDLGDEFEATTLQDDEEENDTIEGNNSPKKNKIKPKDAKKKKKKKPKKMH